MTVQELIEQLQDLPPERMNASVYLFDNESGETELIEIVEDHLPRDGTELGYIILK